MSPLNALHRAVGTASSTEDSAPSALSAGPAPTRVDAGEVVNGKVKFPPWRGAADRADAATPAPMPPDERVGFALVGLGRLTLQQLLPAFAQCKKARVVALVSGSPEKMQAVARQYGIGACYSYDEIELLAINAEVQCVYIVLPNAMHRAFTERAAAAGKHVLCEKPLATSSDDARAMVDACRNAGVKLMTAYRIHYQPHNLRARQLVADGTHGRIVAYSATNVQSCADNAPEQWRHKAALSGGGALPDIGLYCLNTARFISGEEPEEVMAWQHSPPGDARFAEVEATLSFSLRFASGFVASCHCSYAGREDKHQRINLERATLDMPDAYSYQGQRLLIGQRVGDDAGTTDLELPPANQFAAEIDHMAACILDDRVPDTPGEEGLRDQLLMEAIYQSARTGLPVRTASLNNPR